MIIDGKQIAEELYTELHAQARGFGRPLRLGIIACNADKVIESFIGIKSRSAERLGVELVRENVSSDSGEEACIETVKNLGARVDGIIVQLPIPERFSIDTVLAAIPKEKDVDGLNPETPDDERLVEPPVALAVEEILRRTNTPIDRGRAVVVGEGRLVGAPSARLLRKRGGDVSVVTLGKGSLSELKDADIIVSGAGSPGLITPNLIKEGVVLIDAGASEQAGRVVGDADPVCAPKCSVFTPVPGGVGPIAVAKIFENLITLSF